MLFLTLQRYAKVLNNPLNRDMVVEFEVIYDSNDSNDKTKCWSGLLDVISGPRNRFQRSRSVNEACVVVYTLAARVLLLL